MRMRWGSKGSRSILSPRTAQTLLHSSRCDRTPPTATHAALALNLAVSVTARPCQREQIPGQFYPNPRYRSTYWTRWVMGVISGIVLSQLVYDLFVTSTSAPKAGATIPGLIGGPLLALFGGYSVDVVHSILNRIINAVSSVF